MLPQTARAIVSKNSPPCSLPVICFEKLLKSLITHGNCQFLRNGLPVFLEKCPCFRHLTPRNAVGRTREIVNRGGKVAPREVDNPLSLNERRLPPAVNAAFEQSRSWNHPHHLGEYAAGSLIHCRPGGCSTTISVDHLLCDHARARGLGGAMSTDLLGPPGWCSGCWPHDGEVAGSAVADSTLVISAFRGDDGARVIAGGRVRPLFDGGCNAPKWRATCLPSLIRPTSRDFSRF